MMVVENGLGARDTLEPDGTVHDSYRIDYLRSHIQQMAEAVKDGVDLMGLHPLGLHRPGVRLHRRDGQALRLYLRQEI